MTGRPLNALGEFLAARRARVTPAEVGLPAGGVRRVPGLRREEVATLTGLSVDYYARLEQGREQNPSASVLNALARTLQLDGEARRYLFAAAAPDAAAPDSAPELPLAGATRLVGTHQVGENLLALVDDMAQHPVLLLDECHNVLAGNPVGLALYGGSVHSDNLARRVFLDPSSRDLYREWPKTAASIVASIRAAVLHDRGDGALTALVGELSVASDEFAQLWAKAEVREKRSDIVRFAHPLVGDLDLTFETLRPASAPELLLKIYRADRGSATEERLALLGILVAQDARLGILVAQDARPVAVGAGGAGDAVGAAGVAGAVAGAAGAAAAAGARAGDGVAGGVAGGASFEGAAVGAADAIATNQSAAGHVGSMASIVTGVPSRPVPASAEGDAAGIVPA